MARALFNSWFVDFEPVQAKMEGRWRRGESLSGIPADLYDLFPDWFVDWELGDMPEGLEVKVLDDTLELLSGGTPRTSVAAYCNVRTAVNELQQRTHGITFDTITRQTFNLFKTILPPVEHVNMVESRGAAA